MGQVIMESGGSCELDVFKEFQNFTGDVISRAAFGSCFEEGRTIFLLQQEQAKLLVPCLVYEKFPLFRFLPTKVNRRMRQIYTEVRTLLRGIIEKRQRAIEMGKDWDKEDLLGLMLMSNLNELQESQNSNGDKILVVVVVVNMMGVVGEICGKWLSGTAMEVANGGNTQYGMEKLVGNNNYKYWRMCMEAYLQGQNLWELVIGADAGIPTDIPEHAESRRKWKIKCGKTLFALRTSISKEFIDHVRDVSSPKEVWDTLEKLCTKKNTARLQLLENELAMLKQGGMSISEYFLRVKSIYAEISKIDEDDKISEARLRRYLVGGLRKEHGPFVTSIQGWSQQPSIEELENLLSNQEALAKQMAKNFESDAVLFSKGKLNKKNTSAWNKTKEEDSSAEKGGNSQSKKSITCFRCGKTGHIKRNCRVKISKANVACASEGDDQLKWEQCFTVEEKSVQTLVNYVKNDKEEWIIDSGCSHHVTGNDTLFSEMRQHHGERVIVIADNSTYPVAEEGVVTIDVADDTRTSSVKLNDVYHVPGLKKNLVSVSQITDSGKYVLFGPNDVKVLDNVKDISADVILTREKKASLFVLSAGEAYVKKTSQINSAAIWHARLGHVGYQML
ncbi:hypothetical protein Patl1_07274 [Pistacia atlantica]|uniref:Uncharacterized protein n=1 Tax=Pistacia atlantica TaxID=434234 RepID=A0ACC1AIW9_9ROSI|nr:hypothetical protein Patl1_07274 [Pistacia atlantica]